VEGYGVVLDACECGVVMWYGLGVRACLIWNGMFLWVGCFEVFGLGLLSGFLDGMVCISNVILPLLRCCRSYLDGYVCYTAFWGTWGVSYIKVSGM